MSLCTSASGDEGQPNELISISHRSTKRGEDAASTAEQNGPAELRGGADVDGDNLRKKKKKKTTDEKVTSGRDYTCIGK
jgi:hypothetical protein